MSRIHPASHTLRLLTIAMSGALGIAYPLASSAHTKTGTHKSGKIIHITGVRKTGHKAHAPLKAQYTEHAIGAQAIRHASPAQNAQTILARKPSINAFSTGPNGVRSTITFRAFTSGQFTETFDGTPVNQQFAGGPGWSQDPRLYGHQHGSIRYHPAPRGRCQKREARLEHRQCLQPPLCRGGHQQL